MNNTILSLLEFILSFSVLLTLHELGHFLVGKLFKIKAEEFGFGFPPKLVKLFSWDDTDFTLNLIPFGAFVRFSGENDTNIPGGLAAANKWKRLATLLAGPGANILSGILLFGIVISQIGLPVANIVNIVSIEQASPAETAGMLPGDTIKSVAGFEIRDINQVSEIIRQNLEIEIPIVVQRGDQLITLKIVPRANPPDGEGPLGIVMQNPVEKISFLQAIPYGGKIAVEQFRQLLSLPFMMLRGEIQSEEMRLLSPKGIYDVYSQVREDERQVEQNQPGLALINIAWFFGIISIAIGFSNLLPIPALDGGHILFVLPEILFGKRVPAELENMVHLIGFTALIMLMAYVFYQDFVNPIVLP